MGMSFYGTLYFFSSATLSLPSFFSCLGFSNVENDIVKIQSSPSVLSDNQEIQPLVLSLLSLKEAARTSLVSRNWTKFWTRHPNLCFDGTKNQPNDKDTVKIERAKFIETVNSIIQQHSGMVYFHVSGLVHFEYNGALIPIALHGCTNLEKATVNIERDNIALGNAFDAIPSISAVKVLNIHADIKEYQPVWVSQVHMLTMRPTCMFRNLRYLTCEIIVFTDGPNSYSGLLQLARYLEFSPHLEVLQLHDSCWSGEVTGEELSCMRHLHHLKIVYMSGFRCYRAQVELLGSILEKSTALELVTTEPKPQSLSPILFFSIECRLCFQPVHAPGVTFGTSFLAQQLAT
ncbi:hypothetical protein PR202_gb28860 [Eleusine coracana subsp. coracana]|uniref:At1g61320/AtMIF1 LRR domain-containing protein n=1 Tax=Eleusine coracana subsp. coracana TaxID=191504 RepID=A0AAV5FY17_ELECO|nr:hypothetical protein PR202_gb28860 [Eleusine coracana subsp. coracana]